jgi:hypothetical protein
MAGGIAGPLLYGLEKTERSVWVVVDPRDLVTGERVSGPLRVRLRNVTAQPIAARSGVYCFTDLRLPAGGHTVRVEPLSGDRSRYFAAQKDFVLETVPVPGNPLRRNPVVVELLPRPAYPFDAQATLAHGLLERASDSSAIEAADIALVLEGVDQGLRGRADERGAFVVFLPPTAPEDDPDAVLKDRKFRLRFEIGGGTPPHVTDEKQVKEGSAIALGRIVFPGT